MLRGTTHALRLGAEPGPEVESVQGEEHLMIGQIEREIMHLTFGLSGRNDLYYLDPLRLRWLCSCFLPGRCDHSGISIV